MNETEKETTAQLLTTFNYNKQHLITNNYIKSSAVEQQRLQSTAFSNKGLKASVEKHRVSSLGEEVSLPSGVKSLKLDLFNNATDEDLLYDKNKFKLAMNIIKADGDKIQCAAALNSPIRNFKRGIVNKNSQHYKIMAELIVENKHLPEFRVSKFYQSANKQMITIQEWSVCLWQLTEGYMCVLVMGTDIMPVYLSDKNITRKQRANNVIASWGKVIKSHPIIWGNELLKSKK